MAAFIKDDPISTSTSCTVPSCSTNSILGIAVPRRGDCEYNQKTTQHTSNNFKESSNIVFHAWFATS
ncbi:uncharacterized protein METZ01_LOCUS259442 [marine metagenome]|uniref:Uncharacterized protein n=1 Tax=marine metagenome TaxID=408172 RepID=A0A382J477_9ZZZZ